MYNRRRLCAGRTSEHWKRNYGTLPRDINGRFAHNSLSPDTRMYLDAVVLIFKCICLLSCTCFVCLVMYCKLISSELKIWMEFNWNRIEFVFVRLWHGTSYSLSLASDSCLCQREGGADSQVPTRSPRPLPQQNRPQGKQVVGLGFREHKLITTVLSCQIWSSSRCLFFIASHYHSQGH